VVAERLRPMLATTDVLPEGKDWQFEFKWDGIRVIVDWDGTALRLLSRNGNDVTVSWPEVAGLGLVLGSEPAILDGELVVMNEQRRPDFGLLQQRLHVRDPATVARLAEHLPATLLLFDVLTFAGHDARPLPLSERRRLLEQLELDGPSWKVPPVFVGDGEATMAAAERLELEGAVAKRLGSTLCVGKTQRFLAQGQDHPA
jgi:bifunctional non-homologous end joining protein LigD